MPSLNDIQRYLTGTWRLMMGRPDGIKLLDISADGFWNSFLAIPVALPALIADWVTLTNSIAPVPVPFGTRLSIMLRLATVELGAWVLPLAAFMLAARRAGLAD